MDNIDNINDFNNLCRICLKLEKGMCAFFGTDLIYKLYESIGIKLVEVTNFPHLICEKCSTNINSAFSLKQLCIHSEQILLNAANNKLSDLKKADIEKVNTNYANNVQISETDFIDCSTKIKDDAESMITDEIESNNFEEIQPTDETSNLVKKNNEYKTILKYSFNEFTTRGLCTECGKDFRYPCRLKAHMSVHIPKEKRSFYCTCCDKSYKSEESLYQHRKKFHGKNPQIREVCNLCGKSIKNLDRHKQLMHNDNKPFQCLQCDKKFPFQSSLNIHIREVHEGIKNEKNLLCTKCGKRFQSQRDLKSHLSYHTGEKLYKCNVCGQEFRWKSGYYNHTQQHAKVKDKKYKCSQCEKKFFTKDMLENHMRTHTGERPFLCKICKKTFAQKTTLRTHLKIHNLLQKVKI